MTSKTYKRWKQLTIVVIAYLSFCHRAASDAHYWMIRTLFIAVNTLCLNESAYTLYLNESASAFKNFQ